MTRLRIRWHRPLVEIGDARIVAGDGAIVVVSQEIVPGGYYDGGHGDEVHPRSIVLDPGTGEIRASLDGVEMLGAVGSVWLGHRPNLHDHPLVAWDAGARHELWRAPLGRGTNPVAALAPALYTWRLGIGRHPAPVWLTRHELDDEGRPRSPRTFSHDFGDRPRLVQEHRGRVLASDGSAVAVLDVATADPAWAGEGSSGALLDSGWLVVDRDATKAFDSSGKPLWCAAPLADLRIQGRAAVGIAAGRLAIVDLDTGAIQPSVTAERFVPVRSCLLAFSGGEATLLDAGAEPIDRLALPSTGLAVAATPCGQAAAVLRSGGDLVVVDVAVAVDVDP